MPQTFIEDKGISPKIDKFIADYHATYKVDRIPSPVSAAQGYDAVLIFAEAVKQAKSTDPRKIKEALENLQTPVKGVITTWVKPYSKWDRNDVTTHEAFRRQQVVMGKVQDGRVVFSNPADKERLKAQAAK
jgi:branched-chain amino acid transport system substrate-binding protein